MIIGRDCYFRAIEVATTNSHLEELNFSSFLVKYRKSCLYTTGGETVSSNINLSQHADNTDLNSENGDGVTYCLISLSSCNIKFNTLANIKANKGFCFEWIL